MRRFLKTSSRFDMYSYKRPFFQVNLDFDLKERNGVQKVEKDKLLHEQVAINVNFVRMSELVNVNYI